MLEKFEQLSYDTLNIIVYADSAILKSIIKDMIKERFQIKRNTTRTASTTKELKEVKADTLIPPFGGGLWLVDVEADEIPIKEIGTALNQNTMSSVNVFWVSKYIQYKRLVELDIVQKQGSFCFTAYTGRLYPEDIGFLHSKMVPKEYMLKQELLEYVKKNYTYDVQAVCELLTKLRQGEEVNSKKDIISKIGIGGNTVDSFLIKLLTANPKTDLGGRKALENNLILLKDLNFTYNFGTIRRFMLNSLAGIIDMKQLQIMGNYSRIRQEIPEGYNEMRIRRLRRFEKVILEDINMARVLNLKMSLQVHDSYNFEVALLQGIMYYLQGIQLANENNPESTEMPVKRRSRR